MSKILIIGNGFDLFHHLPTKYQHFMAVMRAVENLSDKEKIVFNDLFDEAFSLKFENETKFILEKYNVDKIKYDSSNIEELKDLLSQNVWYRYFKTVLELETWIDFEIEIENILRELTVLFDFATEDLNRELFSKYRLNINEDFVIFGITSLDKEDAIVVNNEYLNPRNNKIDEKKILNHLASSLDQFIIIFNIYLAHIIGGFYQVKKEKSKLPFNLIEEIHTFNYTPTIEMFYNVDSKNINYLHGKSNIKNDLQNLVLGVSEISSGVKKHKMFYYTKYYQKIIKNTNNKFVKFPTGQKNNMSETIFYVIGHSLDESDKEYIIELFDFLKVDNNKYSKICVFYFNENDKNNKLNNLLSIIDKNIILEMHKEKRLYFVELNEQNIATEFQKTLKMSRQGGIKYL